MMKILEKNIVNLHGEKGRKWLDSLPSLVEKISAKWRLANIQPVKNMSWNFVATAKSQNANFILKIGYDKKLIIDEYKALKTF